jgi:hypothetical protein
MFCNNERASHTRLFHPTFCKQSDLHVCSPDHLGNASEKDKVNTIHRLFQTNQEIKVFNRKLCKYMKFFDYASSVEVKFDRDHHTRHGLHLNMKGKAHSVKLLMTAINGIFKKSKMTPISVIWNERQEVSLNKNTD